MSDKHLILFIIHSKGINGNPACVSYHMTPWATFGEHEAGMPGFHGANSPVKGKTNNHYKNRNKKHVNCEVL